MASETEAKIAALLYLLAVLLLIHTLLLQPPRFLGPAATTLITDLLLSTLEFDGRRLVDLVNRRNMILLCHAILLIILKDAGLLATPARRCAATTRTSTASASAAAGGGASSEAQPQERSIVVWRNKGAKNATIADGGRLKRQGRGPRSAKVTACRALPLAEAAATEREEAVVQELALVEEVERSSGRYLNDVDHATVREIVPVEDKGSCFSFDHIDDHEDRNRGEEAEVECCDDVEEMNKRFEEFIANTRRRMQLEYVKSMKTSTSHSSSKLKNSKTTLLYAYYDDQRVDGDKMVELSLVSSR